ncbi:capsular biosynthesis protein [Virgibacillus indicus]|uniref:Capsular biosynthesis protein n=1 Tax=Virgibacillus indicus TaxID=2024554 RepID=A0A265NCT7_9BACI|nr:glycosyltransferase [Virgibacillus indicus]OZU89279.1 capsular biosynthesis protein [Virgibacillus indicus]
MKPAISIIVPVYNIEPYIRKCLDSILAQTFTDFEVIVVNDGSTDDSGLICNKYAYKDLRVKVIHKEYGGVSSARNVGIRAARGEYIGFVDGDDYIAEQMYATLHQMCQKKKSDIAVCVLGREIDGELINPDTGNTYRKELGNEEAMRELFKGKLYRFSLCNKLFKKSCFEGIQFPEGRIHEDLSTTYRLFANAGIISYSNFIGYIYVKRSNSILTSRFHQGRMDAFIGWNEILEFMNKHYKQVLADVYACYGYWCVDNIYYVLNQIIDRKDKELYLMKIQNHVKMNYKELMKNKLLSYKYKSIVYMIHYNIHLLIFSSRIKRVFSN